MSDAGEFEIEDDVPMPADADRSYAIWRKYPWEKLQLNQSFFVAIEFKRPRDIANKASRAVAAHLNEEREFRGARDEKNGKRGVRFWRVK